MRRIAGNVLIGFAALGAVGAVLMAGGSIVEMRRTHPTSDRYVAAEGILLLAGAVFGLGAILFLTGRHWRRPRPEQGPEVVGARPRRRLLPLALYLGVSIGIGLLAGLGNKILPSLGPFAFLICQPTFLVQILLGGFLGLRFEEGAARYAVFVTSNLLYFVAFFYPVYSMVVMDRVAEVVRCRLMKTMLILFVSAHLLIGLALLAISRA